MMSKQNKHILLTGAGGSIGRETLRQLCEKPDQYTVRAFDLPQAGTKKYLRPYKNRAEIIYGDIRNAGDVATAVAGVDAVIHLAALIPPEADRRPADAYKTNKEGTESVVRQLENANSGVHLIYSSSISVYGSRLSKPWIKVGDPLCPSPKDEYAVSKVDAEAVIRESTVPWTIFRLTGVLRPDAAMDPLLFHMPLDTSFEILTVKDCAGALINAIEQPKVRHRILNLAGGPSCRIRYRDFLNRAFETAGLGSDPFPREAFAAGNFHCGFYEDSDETESLLHFQNESVDDYFEQMAAHHPAWQRRAAKIFRPLILKWMLSKSDPWRALKKGSQNETKHFFPENDPEP